MLRYAGVVSSEGGPFLISDMKIARYWRGTEDDSLDYDRAIIPIDEISDTIGHLVSINNSNALIWQMEGAGSCDIYLTDETEIILLQAWLDNSDKSTLLTLAQAEGIDRTPLGSIELASGIVAILWAVESGECITGTEEVSLAAQPNGPLAINGSALLVKVTAGHYSAWYDFVQGNGDEARRLHLVRQS